MRNLVLSVLAVCAVATPCLAVDCKDQTAAQQAAELTNMHRTIVQMSGVRTIQDALKKNIRILTRARGYARITPMAQSVELSRGALAYAENICLPVTEVEANTLATMFLGVYAATDNTDNAAIARGLNRLYSTDEEKLKGKAKWRSIRVASAVAIEKALGELAATKAGEKIIKGVRGGWKGAIASTLLTPSDIGPGDAVAGPGSPPAKSSASVTREGRPDSIHARPGAEINDAPRETTERASATAYVAFDPQGRALNDQWIEEARAAIKAPKR